MRLQYCSDLHLEFRENKNFLSEHPIEPTGEILLLAGDVVPFVLMEKHHDFFNFISDHFQTTYWLPGNHEYYHFDISKRSGILDENIRTNVHLVNNRIIEKDTTRLIFSTLWSDINPDNHLSIEKNLSDFHLIQYKEYRFSVDRYNELHKNDLQFIETELKHAGNGKTIVVTHHVPTFLNYPAQYAGSNLNEAFAVELSGLITATNPDYWIYGHHHNNTPGFKISKTQMLTNQLGYVKYGEQKGFKTDSVIEIKKNEIAGK